MGCPWGRGLLLQIDEAAIGVHEADDPNALVYFFDSKTLTGQNGWSIEALALHADVAQAVTTAS